MMGNSTGGRVVQVMAGLHPELVSRIIVEDVGLERPASIANGFAQRVQQERRRTRAGRRRTSSSR